MVSQLTIVVDDSMLGARIINHSILTSNEHFLTNGMHSTIVVLILCDNLDIDTGDRRQLDSTEDITALRAGYESFSRLREHNFGAVDITFVTIFVLQDAVLQTLQSNSLAHITLAVIVIHRNNFNTSRRNVERNLSTLDNQNLTIYISSIGLGNHVTLGVTHFTLALGSSFCFVNSCQKILVGTQCVTTNNLVHLTGEQREVDRTTQVNLAADFQFGR